MAIIRRRIYQSGSEVILAIENVTSGLYRHISGILVTLTAGDDPPPVHGACAPYPVTVAGVVHAAFVVNWNGSYYAFIPQSTRTVNENHGLRDYKLTEGDGGVGVCLAGNPHQHSKYLV